MDELILDICQCPPGWRSAAAAAARVPNRHGNGAAWAVLLLGPALLPGPFAAAACDRDWHPHASLTALQALTPSRGLAGWAAALTMHVHVQRLVVTG